MDTPPAPSRPWSRRTEGAVVVAFWIGLGTLVVARGVARADGALDPGEAAETFAEMGVWALLTPLVFGLVRWASERAFGLGRLALYVGVGLAIAFGVEAVTRGAFRPLLTGPVDPDRAWSVRGSVLRLRMLDEFVVYLAVLTAGAARAALFQVHERRAEADGLRAARARLEVELAQARLSALTMQLQPHFLFNTLNAVSALVERDPAGVRTMIARLSSLLRRVLETRADLVPLHEEAAFLRDYLDLQRVRFQDRLAVREDWAPGTLGALVPPLILQPLVENAVGHGVSRIEDGAGVIRVASRREGDRLVLTVQDDGPGFRAGGAPGVGIANTRSRLDALFGDAAGLAVTSSAGGVVARVTLPFCLADGDATRGTSALAEVAGG